MGLYGYQLQMDLSISEWHKLLDALGKTHGAHKDNRVTFGEDDANATYQFSATYGRILDANSAHGHNQQLMRCGVIVLAYSIWVDQYRAKIAAECGVVRKNDVNSEISTDLNIYRQAAVHGRRIVRNQPRVLPFLSKDAALQFSSADMQSLFKLLIHELNRLGRVYYHAITNFALSHTLN